MQWYYSKNNLQQGPVSDDELRAKLAFGEVTNDDKVWREGMVDWQLVAAVDELRTAVRPQPGSPPPMGDAGEVSPYIPPAAVAAPVGVPAYTPTSGLAIASLVCGIMGLVSCLFLPGIPAVICGHMAMRQMADPAVRMSGRGMALAGLITGYISVGILVFSVLMTLFVLLAAGSAPH